jgi:hypothetical protein
MRIQAGGAHDHLAADGGSHNVEYRVVNVMELDLEHLGARRAGS